MSQSPALNDFKKNQQPNLFTDSEVKLDPFLYVNRVIRDRIKQERISHLMIPLGFHALATVILQPLNVVGTLLQLSVKEHKNIYNDPLVNQYSTLESKISNPKIQTTAVSKINKDITLIEKKKLELQMLSGGKHKPFTAPVYSSYMEAIKNLYQQGFKSFFKGLFSTSVLQFYRSSLRYGILAPYIYREKGEVHPFTVQILSYFALTLADIALNYIHMTESRFILQSSASQFSTYRNIKQFVSSQWAMKKWMTIGWKVHFFRNFFILSTDNNAPYLFFLNYLLAYPANTAYKRMLCQSQDAGMIPTRYSSVWHCFKLTLQEQGLRGLYKGFSANATRQLLLFAVFRQVYSSHILFTNSYWLENLYDSQKAFKP